MERLAAKRLASISNDEAKKYFRSIPVTLLFSLAGSSLWKAFFVFIKSLGINAGKLSLSLTFIAFRGML